MAAIRTTTGKIFFFLAQLTLLFSCSSRIDGTFNKRMVIKDDDFVPSASVIIDGETIVLFENGLLKVFDINKGGQLAKTWLVPKRTSYLQDVEVFAPYNVLPVLMNYDPYAHEISIRLTGYPPDGSPFYLSYSLESKKSEQYQSEWPEQVYNLEKRTFCESKEKRRIIRDLPYVPHDPYHFQVVDYYGAYPRDDTTITTREVSLFPEVSGGSNDDFYGSIYDEDILFLIGKTDRLKYSILDSSNKGTVASVGSVRVAELNMEYQPGVLIDFADDRTKNLQQIEKLKYLVLSNEGEYERLKDSIYFRDSLADPREDTSRFFFDSAPYAITYKHRESSIDSTLWFFDAESGKLKDTKIPVYYLFSKYPYAVSSDGRTLVVPLKASDTGLFDGWGVYSIE